MIIRRLRVEGFRCFRNPVELDGLGLGAHVIHAPNETGKSTLVLALARALFDRYGARGEDMLRLRPWGTTLIPRVAVEVEAAGTRYLLEKSFLDGASSVLSTWTGAGFERVADGPDADDRARSLLLASVAERGATDVGHWGLARLLWLPQTPERMRPPGLTETLRQRLLDVVGATALGEHEQTLLRRIEEECLVYFIKSGHARRGNPLAEAEARVAAAEADIWECTRRGAETEQLGEAIAEDERALHSVQEQLVEQRALLAQSAEEANREAQIERLAEAKRRDAQAAAERCAALRREQDALAALDREVEHQRDHAEHLAPQLDVARRMLAEATARAAKMTDALKAVAACVEDSEEALRLGRLDERVRQLAADRDRYARIVRKAAHLADQLDARRREQKRSSAPSAPEVRQAEALQRRLLAAEAGLAAAGLRVEVTTLGGSQTVTWDGAQGESAATHRIESNESVAFSGADRGVLSIPGIVRVEIRSGAAALAELRQQRDEAQREFARQLSGWHAADMDALRAQAERAQERQSVCRALEVSLADVLTEQFASLEEAQAALAEAEGELAAAAVDLGRPAEEVLNAAPEADAVALEAALRKAVSQHRACTAQQEASEDARTVAERRVRQLERRRAECLAAAAALESQHAACIAAGGDSAALARALEDAAAKEAVLAAAAAGLAAQLPTPEGRASTRSARLEDAVEWARAQHADLRERIAAARARLEQALQEGLYSRLSEAEERLAIAREDFARHRTRAAAARLLCQVACSRRDGINRSLVAPVEDGVRHRLDFLRGAGTPHMMLSLDYDLAAATIRVGGPAMSDGGCTGDAIPGNAVLEDLSWGTQEQAMFTLRLTLGSLLAGDGASRLPQLIVLDDALVNTDDTRHARAVELIQEAAERLQILILTAFPERYRMLHARLYDLVALRRATATAPAGALRRVPRIASEPA